MKFLDSFAFCNPSGGFERSFVEPDPLPVCKFSSWLNVGFVRVFSMGFSAVFNSSEVTIAPDDSITALDLNLNDEVFFLQVKVAESFTKLLAYSVKSISNRHFYNIKTLKLLTLHGNQIESISNDAFLNLKSLNYLGLCKLSQAFLS